MKLRDFAPNLFIDPAKFTAYALNENHPKGKHKARVMAAALGFTANNYHALLGQIEAQSLDAEAQVHKVDSYGRHLQVDLLITGTAGQKATVRTGWLVAPNSDTAFLSTLYVLGTET